MPNNGDTKREFKVGNLKVRDLGTYHKTLPHNQYGEVDTAAFDKLVAAAEGDGTTFAQIPKGAPTAAALANPQGGLASYRLTHNPASYSMPPAPKVLSVTTAAEMIELYWMALLRDVPFDQFDSDPDMSAPLQWRSMPGFSKLLPTLAMQGIVGDCRQLKTDVDSYNDNQNTGESIQLVLDFTDDMAEYEALKAVA